MSLPTPEMTNILQFMEVRAPFSPDSRSLQRNYIYDDFIGKKEDKPGRFETDLQAGPSTIGRAVYSHVFCGLELEIFSLLKPYKPTCPGADSLDGTKLSLTHKRDKENRAKEGLPERIAPLSITELERSAYVVRGGLYYLLPERLEQIDGLVLYPALQLSLTVLNRAALKFDAALLIAKLETAFNVTTLREIVFTNGIYAKDFQNTKRILFDTLYLLYMSRRHASVNLEHVINGLRVLHVLEALSIDSLVETVKSGTLSPADEELRRTLEAIFPELNAWNGTDALPTLPLIQSADDLHTYLRATPVIHPIFARLRRYRQPFNDLKLIGIGDLKVVKQWLTGYAAGEIAHIENVLKGELKSRVHRHMEKSEDTFSFSSDVTQSNQKDIQTTDRFELKREVENIVKTDLKAGANANLTYNHPTGMIIANVATTFAYGSDTSDQTKVANTLAGETVNKAIENIQKATAEKRSFTKQFETEETNKHIFDNKAGEGHVSGIYRWLDKKYKAQLFNYGKRMMFEFIIPEPAAFYVESRLRAFDSIHECPQRPKPPKLKKVSLSFVPAGIDEAKFQKLQQQYDLSEFIFPQRTRTVDFVDSTTGQGLFREAGLDSTIWQSKTYACKLNNAKGYRVSTLTVTGRMHFWGKIDSPIINNPGIETDQNQQNTLEVYIDGQRMAWDENNGLEYWVWRYPGREFSVTNSSAFSSDDVTLNLGFWDIANFELTLHASLTIGDQTLLDWQTKVYSKIRGIEQQRVDKENEELQAIYASQMSDYRNRLSELKATAVNDVLQGQSEAFNRELIRTELKKHCLTMITKEYDTDDLDALIALKDPIKAQKDKFAFPKLQVRETANTTSFEFKAEPKTIEYPSIDIREAKEKGRYIQFLEQAFDWQQLAYIFYPYFWAQRPDWIQMMNRIDDADPNMTAFLQAGSARVLLAVTPGYDDAVLHFLATREPWEGGPAPVIGDPLFIPLHEELRKSQDDLRNATPVGEPWAFTLPTSLIYLDDSGAHLPDFPDVP